MADFENRQYTVGLDVLVEKDCDEGGDPTQEEIEQNLQGPKSVIDKKTDLNVVMVS